MENIRPCCSVTGLYGGHRVTCRKAAGTDAKKVDLHYVYERSDQQTGVDGVNYGKIESCTWRLGMYLIALVIVLVVLFFLIVMALGIPALPAPEQASLQSKLEQLENWLRRLHGRGKFQGVVLLAKDGQTIFAQGYGYADTQNKQPLTATSSFNLASVSKQFTATGIMLLKHQGKLSYADELQMFIPELSCYRGISIRCLLTHTSGLPDYFAVAMAGLDPNETVTTEKLIRLYGDKQPKIRFTCGEKFEYNNMGYVLLAEIIARVSGKSFADFMVESFFRPLGMKHTKVFNLLSGEEPVNRVFGFKRQFFLFGRKKLCDLNRFDGVAGDGGIYSSAEDLLIWHQALLSGAALPVSELDEAYGSAVLNDGRKTGYGFGWFIKNEGIVEHAGGWQGFATYLYRDLATNTLIVVLDNTCNILRVSSNGRTYNSIPLNLQRFLQRF
jgi:N-acyl-D-amino-acid deacylase